MELLIISVIIGLLLASKKKTPADPGNGSDSDTETNVQKKSQGYYFKPAFVDTAPRTQTTYPADKWTIKNNELFYEYTYPDGTIMWKTPLIQGFDRRPLPIYPEALQRLKEFWSIPSADLKQLAMYEFNQNPANMRDYNGKVPHFKYNNLRDLV